jgi:hypothetical protein
LKNRKIATSVQRKSHRDDDLFDFKFRIDGEDINLDLKTVHYYTNYSGVDRQPFTIELIERYFSYSGPDWRFFFPMLIPHTQIAQAKDAYCFAIASSIDPRADSTTNRDAYALTAFPFGENLSFLSSKKLCLCREENSKGIYLSINFLGEYGLFKQEPIKIKILGEWANELKIIERTIKPNCETKNIGPFSCVCSFQISPDDLKSLNGELRISISKNEFEQPILNTNKRNINSIPKHPLSIFRQDFCNLILPKDYRLYFIGWITKEKFLKACKNYSGWVWPLDKKNKFENQAWSQLTERDLKLIDKLGFTSCISREPSRLNVGLMKTHGHGGGACCYVFPNIGRNGGVNETNLYVLPNDLSAMDTLGKSPKI